MAFLLSSSNVTHTQQYTTLHGLTDSSQCKFRISVLPSKVPRSHWFSLWIQLQCLYLLDPNVFILTSWFNNAFPLPKCILVYTQSYRIFFFLFFYPICMFFSVKLRTLQNFALLLWIRYLLVVTVAAWNQQFFSLRLLRENVKEVFVTW